MKVIFKIEVRELHEKWVLQTCGEQQKFTWGNRNFAIQ